MPKSKKGSSKKGSRPTASGGAQQTPWEDESDNSFEEFWQKCHDAALWSLGKAVQLAILAYGTAVLCAVYVYGSALRGSKSIAGLGTAALLLLVWATVISSGAVLVARIGWTTLLFLAALAFGLFRYYGPFAGMIVLGVYSVAGLFLGGSPWLTTLVTVAGCALFYFNYTALALLGTLCYSSYSVYRMGGLLGLSATFLVACVSNDVIQYLAAQLPPEPETPGPEKKEESARSSREWSWKDKTGGSGWGSGTSGQHSSRENFYNSAYGESSRGGRGSSSTSGPGGGGTSRSEAGRGDGAGASTSGSSSSWGASGRPGREAPKPSESSSSSRQNGGYSDRNPYSDGKQSSPRGGEFPRTSSVGEDLGDAEAEVARIISCTTHWAVLELARGATVDVAEAKKTYHRKARLVHPDKNYGCANAGEAFKCLQTAYETLIDPVKRKDYEDELKGRDMAERLNKMAEDARNHSRGGHGSNPHSTQGGSPFFDPEELFKEKDSKKVHCYTCGASHEWTKVDRPKNRCRWCAECNRYHGAAEGDGWFEQSSRPTFFGLFKQDDPTQAYCVEGGHVYLCTSWVECQGMVGRPNTHKPSFEVKSEGRGRGGGGGGGRGGGRGKGRGKEPDLSDCFESEEDFWNFMEDLMKHGGAPPGSPGPRGAAGGRGAGGGGKPKLSKKQRQKQKRNGW